MEKMIEKQTNIENPNGTKFLISTVKVAGEYQTMVLNSNFLDIEETRTNVLSDALKWHDIYANQYTQKVKPPVRLTDQYLKLVDALKQAAESARPLADTEDGGTCNFDSLELELPRWNEEKTIAAFHAAGLSGFKTTQFRCPVFVISPPISRQGTARTRQAEKMRDVMKELGWDASVWYQMD